MIVCHCTRTTDAEIREAVQDLRMRDPHGLVTPGQVYRALGRRPECGGCQPLLASVIASASPKNPPQLVVRRGPQQRRVAVGGGD
jgi:bacterioferritin-associated ferredoxin